MCVCVCAVLWKISPFALLHIGCAVVLFSFAGEVDRSTALVEQGMSSALLCLAVSFSLSYSTLKYVLINAKFIIHKIVFENHIRKRCGTCWNWYSRKHVIITYIFVACLAVGCAHELTIIQYLAFELEKEWVNRECYEWRQNRRPNYNDPHSVRSEWMKSDLSLEHFIRAE